MNTAATSTPATPARKLRRASRRAATSPAGTQPEAPATPPAALSPEPANAKIRLDATNLTPARLAEQFETVAIGMAATPDYAALEITPEIQNAAAALRAQLDAIATTRRELAAQILALRDAQPGLAALLQQAASACEGANPTPATLIRGGWELRRQPGPPQAMPVPKDLRLRQDPEPGQATARWRTVPNARYYEITLAPVPGAPLTISAPQTIIAPRASAPLPPVEPGTLLTITVRAIGAKGPGPHAPGLLARVS